MSLTAMSPSQSSLRLMLVDDHALVRAGVKALLTEQPAWQVIREASTGHEAVEAIAEFPADVVLMDIRMPRGDGIEATARLRELAPRSRVLMLTMQSSPAHYRNAMAAGAAGYCLKESGTRDLIQAITAVARGEPFISPGLTRPFEESLAHGLIDRHSAGLTGRQRQILELIALGDTSKEIARRLTISVKTVESHRTALMRHLGIHDLAGLVRFAIRIGLVSADDEPAQEAAPAAPDAPAAEPALPRTATA